MEISYLLIAILCVMFVRTQNTSLVLSLRLVSPIISYLPRLIPTVIGSLFFGAELQAYVTFITIVDSTHVLIDPLHCATSFLLKMGRPYHHIIDPVIPSGH
eukprot:scaffold15027_cov86-Skeletonema_dohrnii-CCMP3373.AAC.2